MVGHTGGSMVILNLFKRLIITMTIMLAGLFSSHAVAAEAVGKVEFIMGEVSVIRADNRLEAKTGLAIYEHDHIKTGEKSRVRIKFADNSSMQMGSNAESVVEKYVHTEDGLVDSLLNLVEGRARFIVNKIRSSNSKYQIKMRAVLIGVRGTDILAQTTATHDHVALAEGRVALNDSAHHQLFLNKGRYVSTEAMALPATSINVPNDWLLAFIADVGTSQQRDTRKKSNSSMDNTPDSIDAVQKKMSNTMGTPSIIPR